MIQPSFKVDTREFDKAFVRYVAVSKRSLSEIVNKKATLIAIQSLNFTKKADPAAIKSALGQVETVQRVTKKGKVVNRKRLKLTQARTVNAPLAALIVNKRQAAKGEPGLAGSAMSKAIRKLIGRRLSGVGFIAAGWIPAIKALSKVLKERFGMVQRDTKVRQYGIPKGGAVPAPQSSWNPTATIWNAIEGTSAHNGRVASLLSEGVNKAIAAETASMVTYIERKLKEDAAGF